jgi:hypothetical protein
MTSLRGLQTIGGVGSKLEGAVLSVGREIARVNTLRAYLSPAINAAASTGTGAIIAYSQGGSGLITGTAENIAGDIIEGYLMPNTSVDDIIFNVRDALGALNAGLPAEVDEMLRGSIQLSERLYYSERFRASERLAEAILNCPTAK